MAGNNDRPLAQKEDNNLRTADVLKLAATTPSSSITSSCEDTSPTVAVSAIVRSSSSEGMFTVGNYLTKNWKTTTTILLYLYVLFYFTLFLPSQMVWL